MAVVETTSTPMLNWLIDTNSECCGSNASASSPNGSDKTKLYANTKMLGINNPIIVFFNESVKETEVL